MSIIDLVKDEIITSSFNEKERVSAFLSGTLRGVGSLGIRPDGFEVIFEGQNKLLINKIASLIEQHFNINVLLAPYSSLGMQKNEGVRFKINSNLSSELLLDLAIVKNKYEIIKGIPETLVKTDRLKIDYIKGVFVSCGHLYAPTPIDSAIKQTNEEIKKQGYHLEMNFNSNEIASDLLKLLHYFSVNAKIVSRNKTQSVYIKGSENISDFLAVIGSNKGVMALQEIIISRSIRNLTNRQYNCTIANINKSISASEKQMQAIRIIVDNKGLDTLEESLKKTALIRLENPEYSFSELLQELGEDITKSGLNHRFRKLIKIAENIKEEQLNDKANKGDKT